MNVRCFMKATRYTALRANREGKRLFRRDRIDVDPSSAAIEADAAVDEQLLVHGAAEIVAAGFPAIEADVPVGPEAAVAEPDVSIMILERQRVGGVRGIGKGLRQLGGSALVRVDGEHPLTAAVLERRVAALAEAADADFPAHALEARQDELAAAELALAEGITRFRSEKQTLKANYAAAKAMVEISEVATGLDERISSVGIAVQRARDKTEELEARIGAYRFAPAKLARVLLTSANERA